jgi:hypothetical protein
LTDADFEAAIALWPEPLREDARERAAIVQFSHPHMDRGEANHRAFEMLSRFAPQRQTTLDLDTCATTANRSTT